MKNQWTIWALVGCVIVAILFIVNYQSKKEVVSVGDIFPDETKNKDIEYEFVDKGTDAAQSTTTQSSLSAAKTSIQPVAAVQPQSTVPNTQIAMNTKPAAAPVIPQTPSTAASKTPSVEKTEGTNKQPTLSQIPFTIQAASFKDKNKAELALAGMKAAGQPAYIVEADLKEKGTWYRIYIGNFQTKAQANEFLSKLKPTYKDSFVISPNKKIE